MTREKEILSAARDYIGRVTLSSPSYVIHFENGAEWADEHPNLESLWHDASEEPTDDLTQILYQDNYGDCWLTTKSDIIILGCNWEHFASVNVRRWAYVSDLLPKGGKR